LSRVYSPPGQHLHPERVKPRRTQGAGGTE
jgi:hypothetical protein